MDKQIYSKMREVEGTHWWFAGRRRIVETVIQSLHLQKNARILDAGCGTGGNLAMLNKHGEVKGMEMDNSAREGADSLKLGEIRTGHLPDRISYPADSFELIVLLDVLEHIEDDRASLAVLKTRLTTDGRILITVPAFQTLWGRHDERHHHKRRYNAAQLRLTAEAAGLDVDYITYFNTWLFPLIAMVRLLQRKQSNADSELCLPPKLINNGLTQLFASERLFIPATRLPFGVSLLAVLKSAP